MFSFDGARDCWRGALLGGTTQASNRVSRAGDGTGRCRTPQTTAGAEGHGVFEQKSSDGHELACPCCQSR